MVSSLPISYEASSVSVNPDTQDVAVTADDSAVYIYTLNGTELVLKTKLEHLGAVTDCAYSPDLKYLVASDVNRKVILYSVADDYKVNFLKGSTIEKNNIAFETSTCLSLSRICFALLLNNRR